MCIEGDWWGTFIFYPAHLLPAVGETLSLGHRWQSKARIDFTKVQPGESLGLLGPLTVYELGTTYKMWVLPKQLHLQKVLPQYGWQHPHSFINRVVLLPHQYTHTHTHTHTHTATHNSLYLTASNEWDTVLLLGYNTVSKRYKVYKVSPAHKNPHCGCKVSDVTHLTFVYSLTAQWLQELDYPMKKRVGV